MRVAVAVLLPIIHFVVSTTALSFGQDEEDSFRALGGVGKNWEEMNPEIDLLTSSLSMSRDGRRVAIGSTYSGNGIVAIYKLKGSIWKKMGQNIVAPSEESSAFGSSVSMSEDGLRVAIGDKWYGGEPGQVRIYRWNKSSWEQMGDPIDPSVNSDEWGEGYGQYGKYLSMSDDGNRVAISGDEYYCPGPEVVEWNGSSWNKMEANIYQQQCANWRGPTVSISGNGERLAVGYQQDDEVRVYGWDGAAWEEVGGTLEGYSKSQFGNSLDLSQTGDHLVVGASWFVNYGPARAGYARAFEWKASSWEQVGDELVGDSPEDEFGTSVSMSSDGRRLLIGSPQPSHGGWRLPDGSFQCGDTVGNRTYSEKVPSTRAGYAKIYEWDESAWKQLGETLQGKKPCDGFGGESSMSGDGERVVLEGSGMRIRGPNWPSGAPYVRVYRYAEPIKPRNKFPADFKQVTCGYLDCLGTLLDMMKSLPATFGEKNLDKSARNSLAKTKSSIKDIEGGHVITSLEKLVKAMYWNELLGIRGSKRGKTDAVELSLAIGEHGSTCAADFVDNFINKFLGKGILDDNFLMGEPAKQLRWARNKIVKKKWKKSTRNSLVSVRLMMKELDTETIPLCGEQ